MVNFARVPNTPTMIRIITTMLIKKFSGDCSEIYFIEISCFMFMLYVSCFAMVAFCIISVDLKLIILNNVQQVEGATPEQSTQINKALR